jgi:hypothetical protein
MPDARTGTRLPLALALLLASPLLGGGSCIPDIPVKDATTAAVNVLNDAINALDNASADWQQVLKDAQAKLTQDAQSTIRNEIANVVSRSIAQGGVELRCDADFIRARVRQALIAIRAKLLGQTVPKVEPAFCQVVPLGVDRALVPDRLKQLEFYGYDFDQDTTLRVWLERTGLPRLDVTSRLDRPTHYAMTLKFGANGVQLDDHSDRFALEWEGRTISTVAVIQPQTPICQSQVVQAGPWTVTFVPPHVGSGDREFDGNGPRVNSVITLLPSPGILQAQVYMRAIETKSDWTEAAGSQIFELYRPPAGWAIADVPGTRQVAHSYTDSNHDDDSFSLGGGPVARLVYVGDTDGDEAGTRTKVTVTFNRIPVELHQTGNCLPQGVAHNLQRANLLSPAAASRLAPRMLEEATRVKSGLIRP